jgi:hypothetical protein
MSYTANTVMSSDTLENKQNLAAYINSHNVPPHGHHHQYTQAITNPIGSADALNSVVGQFQALSLPHSAVPTGNNSSMGQMTYIYTPDGQVVVAGLPTTTAPMGVAAFADSTIGPTAAPFLAAPQFNPYLSYPMVPYTPGRASGLQARVERQNPDIPGLETRRGSYSTTESTPATPFYTSVASRPDGARVAGMDRSAFTTPSPQQIATNAILEKVSAISIPSDRNVDELLKKEPAIPKAVPAVFTPAAQMKSLEQSLENRIPGNRNVYIRGLHPTTDDDVLYKYTSRFGEVETSKAIIDTSTGACKGYVIVFPSILSLVFFFFSSLQSSSITGFLVSVSPNFMMPETLKLVFVHFID